MLLKLAIFYDTLSFNLDWYNRIPLTTGDLEKEMATHSSILAWRIPWTDEPGGLRSMGSQRVGHDWSDLAHTGDLSKTFISHSSGGCSSPSECQQGQVLGEGHLTGLALTWPSLVHVERNSVFPLYLYKSINPITKHHSMT